LPIIKKMAEYYGVSHVDLISDRRQMAIALVRQKIMWVIKQVSTLSYPQIGLRFGGRDHTTVLHAVKKIDGMIKANHPDVAEIHRWIRVVERQQIAREFKT
jgi:chromosomal replication initiator protein